MRSLASFPRILACTAHVDFRLGISSLSSIAEANEPRALLEGDALFLFMRRDRRAVKLLYWDRTGFALWAKRLESNRFAWQKKPQSNLIHFDERMLSLLLDGIDVFKMKPHANLRFTCPA